MTKATKPAAAPVPIEQAESKTIVVRETSAIRDDFAMRLAAAIVTGIVSRGGVPALDNVAVRDDELLAVAYRLADSAMRVRAA